MCSAPCARASGPSTFEFEVVMPSAAPKSFAGCGGECVEVRRYARALLSCRADTLRPRMSAFRNETNFIKITSPEWMAWIAHGPQGRGCREVHRTEQTRACQSTTNS